uniref:Uncharacterized protein n=1 Tax=Siphoviridae sp. ctnpt50 TaxID=2827941 RepID=A0A8S5SE82_9CAUD|nr:MAG TPA: hypothetical protein [Siphoviridae sp. ctnpt50]
MPVFLPFLQPSFFEKLIFGIGTSSRLGVGLILVNYIIS